MTRRNKSKLQFNAKNVIVLIGLIAIVGGYYIYTSGIAGKNQITTDEYTILSSKDLEISYPETPREVVKLYSRMVKYLYDDDISAKKTKNVVKQMRTLFSDQLLEKNALDTQLKNLKSDVAAFTKEKKTIIGYEIDESSLNTKEVDGKECATIIVGFAIKKNEDYEHSNELFLLEKDEEGKWKIVGWQITEVESKQDSQDGMEG